MSNIIPGPGKILIKDKEADRVGSFTIQTDENNREGIIGVVLKIGEADERYDQNGKQYLVESPLEIGDIVIYTKYHFSDVYLEGEHYKIIKFDDVLATVEDV